MVLFGSFYFASCHCVLDVLLTGFMDRVVLMINFSIGYYAIDKDAFILYVLFCSL